MVKLKHLKMYDTSEIPDHIMHQMTELAMLLLTEWQEMCKDTESNIALGAWNFAHAVVLVEFFQDTCAHRGAKMSALSLIKNVEMLLSQKGIPFDSIDPH